MENETVITPEILEAVRGGLRTEFQSVFEGVETLWQELATEMASTGSGENYDWLGDMPGIREWIGDRHINELSEQAYRIQNKIYEGTVGVKRTDIEDGKLGSYKVRAAQLADKAGKHPDTLIFDLIPKGYTSRCFDGQNFFDTDHPVGPSGKEVSVSNMQAGAGPSWYLLDTTRPLKPFIWQNRSDVEFTSVDANVNPIPAPVFMKDQYLFGTRQRGNAGFAFWQLAFASKATLNTDNLLAAREAMESFDDNAGERLGVQPSVLLVSTGNRSAAEKLMKAEKIGDEYNTLKGAFEIIVAPRLKG